jgi:hypothetical protein
VDAGTIPLDARRWTRLVHFIQAKKRNFEIPARYNRGMRFRLRTLLIVLALGPPVLQCRDRGMFPTWDESG